MSRKIEVLAIDPAMRNWGLARLMICPHQLTIQVVDLKLVTTESQAGKTVRKSSDDYRRAQEAFAAAHAWAQIADLIMAEVPSGSQSSRASLGAGMSIMGLAALGTMRPLIQVNPIEAKKAVTGRKTASKDEMIAWASAKYPQAPWIRARGKSTGALVDANEHLADALAIAHAGVQTAEFRSAISMFISINGGKSSVDTLRVAA